MKIKSQTLKKLWDLCKVIIGEEELIIKKYIMSYGHGDYDVEVVY